MWDTIQLEREHLSHDLPCPWCGHAVHRVLPCDHCACSPHPMPGDTHAG